MAQEIANQSRASWQLNPLLTKTLEPQKLQSHVLDVGLRLEISSRKYDRFGWDSMSPEIRSLLRADWVAKLADFGIDEIDKAISDYVDDPKNRKAPHEGQVKSIILSNRKKDLAKQQKPPEPERQREEYDPQAIQDEIGFKPKRFGG